MIQPILFFVLGFLCACFLAALVAPAAWRRAVRLTRKRVEASVPLTLAEIQADKDRLRAEYAMGLRKREMEIKSLREKSAEQSVEIGRAQAELVKLGGERDAEQRKASDLGKEGEDLKEELSQTTRRLQELSEKHAVGEKTAAERALELEKLGQMYDEASFTASSRQIELVSREAEIQKLSAELSALREEGKAAARRREEMEVEVKVANAAASAEKKKVAELDKKLQRLMTTVADREDKLDRREKELARLRQQSKGNAAGGGKATRGAGGEIDTAIARLNADRERLEEKLTALAGENIKLKARLSSPRPKSSAGDVPDATLLREQIQDLAAEVVNLTARLEGPNSPIAQALAKPESGAQQGDVSMKSIAERVRALQKDTAG